MKDLCLQCVSVCLRWLSTALLGVALVCAADPSPSVLPIGQLRSGRASAQNPYDIKPRRVGQTVRLQGIIHQKLLWPGSRSDRPNHAFLIQNLPGQADQDPKTSDGCLVYTGKSTIPRLDSASDYQPTVGDWVVLEGRLQHRYGQTELMRPSLTQLVKRGVSLDAALPIVELKPTPNRGKTFQYMEQLEGMRVVLPSHSRVISGRKIIGDGIESYLWVIPGTDPVAKRTQPFHNRIFRDAHPLDDLPDLLFDNDNGTRILIGSHGIKASTGRLDAVLPPLRSGDLLSASLVGGMIYSYGQYKIMPVHSPGFERGMDPSDNVVGGVIDLADSNNGFRVVTYNLENLYDHRDDPTDPCDAHDDPGNTFIKPPFNYLPANEPAYRYRLRGLSQQIVSDLKEPELILVQELEDQDILTFEPGEPSSFKAGKDGLPDVLQELSLMIRALGGPHYGVLQHRRGADTRGISCGFLYRVDKVKCLPLLGNRSWLDSVRVAFPGTEVFGDLSIAAPVAIQSRRPHTDGDGTLVYARPIQVARFQVLSEDQAPLKEMFVINAHFASRPDDRMGLRRDQANLAAEMGKALLNLNPEAGVVLGGDLNVFPRPDDPFAHPPSDQLAAIYEAGARSAYDWVLSHHPENAYSYVFEGQAQTLDHLFMMGEARRWFHGASFVHINSDWPDKVGIAEEGARGISDHDPFMISFR